MEFNSILLTLIIVAPFIVVVMGQLVVFAKVKNNFDKVDRYHQENLDRLDSLIKQVNELERKCHPPSK